MEYRVIASLFCKTATAYNPFIYFFMSKGFRMDTKRIFQRWILSKFQLNHNLTDVINELPLTATQAKEGIYPLWRHMKRNSVIYYVDMSENL